MTSTTWVTAHWSPLYLVDFLGISYLEIKSKRVNLLIFAFLKFYWSKTHIIKSKYLIFTLPLKLFILIIDHAESFFFLSLTHFFIMATYQRFLTAPAQARKQSVRTKTCFPFKIKDSVILFKFSRILKNNLMLFKLDSKTLLVCHSAIGSAKWWNMKPTPTLILLEDISIKIVGRGLLQSYIWLAT